MALGSSAPEIILSLIEIVAGNFFAGALGPSTIVGSAAFNLFIILAVCMLSLPNGETRRIENMGVFILTAAFSLFAYIWLIIILIVSSPDVIEIWEGVVTLLLFPVLVYMAFQADKGRFDCKKMTHVSDMEMQVAEIETEDGRHAHFDAFETTAMLRDVLRSGLDEERMANIAASRRTRGDAVSRAMFRINATRQLTGSHAVLPDYVKAMHDAGEAHAIKDDGYYARKKYILAARDTVGFDSLAYCINENVGHVELRLRRTGDLSQPATVSFNTIDGTATAGEDYVAVKEGSARFEQNEELATFQIEIIDDDIPEDDENFTVHLFNPQPPSVELLADRADAIVTIIDDDRPGVLELAAEKMTVQEGDGAALIHVRRVHGSKGRVTVAYATSDNTAHAPRDYAETSGTLVFENGELEHAIKVPIVDDCEYEKDETFTFTLSEPNGCELGGTAACVVTIKSTDDVKGLVDKITQLLNLNKDRFVVGRSTWAQQFYNAVEWPEKVGRPGQGQGGLRGVMYCDEMRGWRSMIKKVSPPDVITPRLIVGLCCSLATFQGSGTLARVVHVINVPWKLMGATIPPTM
jgi:solute carrier family 8 (sodium/calcium exchanger)